MATVHYQYDSLQRLTGCVSVISGQTFQVSYRYDPEGNLVQLTYPDSNVVYYAYDEAGRLISVTSTMFSGSFHFTYDAAGRLVELDYPNGVAGIWSYDRAGRITGYSYGGGGSSLVARTIQRDGRGWKISEQITAGLLPCAAGCEEHRWYDLADRAGGGGRRDHPPVEWKDLSYSYYAEGNEYYDYVHGQGESYWNRYYPWDKELRPECRTIHDEQQGEWNLYYGYDAAGLRLYRRLEGPGTNQVQVYAYDRRVQPERVLCEYDGEGSWRRSYVWGADRILAQVESDGTVYFFHADELGSTLALSDTNGEIVAQYAYLPYGTIATNSSPLFTPFLWLGGLGVYHEDVPLKKAATVYYMRHRYYDAAQRRFISPDPTSFSDLLARQELLNLYAYADLNPTTYADPSGEYAWVVAGALIGAAIDAGINYTMQVRSENPIDWREVGAAATRGAIVGAVSSLAGPVAGTLVKGAGGLATGLGARLVSVGISAAGSAAGQTAYNAIRGNDLSEGVEIAALFGAGGQTLANMIPVQGVSSLAQASRFAPRHLSSMVATPNAVKLTTSYIVSTSVGAGSSIWSPSSQLNNAENSTWEIYPYMFPSGTRGRYAISK